MKSRTVKKLSIIAILSVVFMFNSYSFNFFVKAEEIPPIDEDDVVIITEDENEVEEIVEDITNDKKIEDEYEDMQDKVLNEEMNVDITSSENSEKLDDATTIIADASEIIDNESYKEELQEELEEGKRVFIYGDIQADEYKDILDVEELSVDAGDGGEFLFGLTTEELNEKAKEDGKQAVIRENKENNEEEETESEFVSHVIGYTLDDSKELQYVDVTIHNFDEEGNPIPNTEESILKTTMDIQSEIMDSEQEKHEEVQEQEVAFFPFLKENKVAAENVRVLNKYNLNTYAKRLGVLVAEITTDYHLYKETSDQDKIYDFFTLEPVTQIQSYKGIWSNSLFVDIDIPYDTDELDSWSPKGDQGGKSFNVGLSYPFSIAISMDFGESLTIDDQSSTKLDYARWLMKDHITELNTNISGETFTPVAGWASKGTLATVGLTVTGKFSNYITFLNP
ncbi:hypothetical protein [Niallia sp. RD1]|uniref:hypothetical protein n=1 Tax=Niallia sp. RD1 TaxID=2962858 RepID=UPI0020C19975|nr:hypothetical protein [Niallia sp. RD1]UTI43911.1 hypothetical protein NKG37_09850 [Niallia sp. RD1]